MAAPRPALDDADDLPEPPRVRALRRLVTALTATLIVGVVAVAGALVIRIAQPAPSGPAFDPADFTAERIALPPGEAIVAVGAAGKAVLFVTRDEAGVERLRLRDPADGAALGAAEILRRETE
jgi:hypothetical protein